MNIGSALRFFRMKLSLSQKDMAPKFLDASAYSRMEGNVRGVKLDELEEMLSTLGILSSEFFMFCDIDTERTNFKDLYFYCGAHLANKSKKQSLLRYYEAVKNSDNKTLAELSNYIAIKNYFSTHWEEVEEITAEEVEYVYNLMMSKSFYTFYDYLIISNIVRLFTAKQVDLIVSRIIPVSFEKNRTQETLRYAYNTLINIISLCLYAADIESADKYIKIAKRQNKSETDMNFKLNLQYLDNLSKYLQTGELVYIDRVRDFIHILEDVGENLHASQVKKEVETLIKDKSGKQMLNEYEVGLFKKN